MGAECDESGSTTTPALEPPSRLPGYFGPGPLMERVAFIREIDRVNVVLEGGFGRNAGPIGFFFLSAPAVCVRTCETEIKERKPSYNPKPTSLFVILYRQTIAKLLRVQYRYRTFRDRY